MNKVYIVAFDFLNAVALVSTTTGQVAVYADADTANAARDEMQGKRVGPGQYIVLECPVL